MHLLAAFFVALRETSIVYPKNFVYPSVIDLVIPLDRAKLCETILAPSKRKETYMYFAGLNDKSKSAAFNLIN